MTTEIRNFKISDYSSAFTLWRSLPGIALSGADSEDAIRIFLEKNLTTCFVAEENGILVGTVLGGSDSRRGYIYHLAVHNDYQGKGLGRRLTEVCLIALKSLGIQKCHIFVINDNLDGQNFWNGLGWVKREDILVMSKDI